ncbi:hypothetical protein [Chamaesiphon polymorphus]|uniref:Uncharacterized protein n=1 Tax=Chamaesiphon polymorphus CCALA 037 TaxID=2107692 RepID=A0A2T1GLF5_9CYAN|nr:hypothetical protein [Chamaesiphon polymorphus]PSB58605.1 hypothetical protein C7B77_04045 [Chamaesiphon polymorphus CCALA 037]
MKYIKEIDLSVSDEAYNHLNQIRPLWARIGTFVECESWDSDTEDDLEQPSLAEITVKGKIYRGSFSCPTSEQLGETFWVIYKPDFSIFTWFNDKPEELPRSGIALVKVIEVLETFINCSFKENFVRFSVDRVIPFPDIARYFEVSSSGNPFPFFKRLIDADEDSFWQYDRIRMGDLIMISVSCQADVGAWLVCQQRDRGEAPTIIVYHENWISDLFTFAGHCQLTYKQWQEIDLHCR